MASPPNAPPDDASDPVSHALVEAIATARNVDPLTLPPLYDAIDPDALDQLVDGGSTAAGTAIECVRLTVAGCDVVVRGDGTVDATAIAEPTPTAPDGGDTAGNTLE